MSEARKAPDGCQWRPSQANPKTLWLVRGHADYIGSIQPKGRRWVNSDTGEVFDDKNAACASVEIFL